MWLNSGALRCDFIRESTVGRLVAQSGMLPPGLSLELLFCDDSQPAIEFSGAGDWDML
jgi:hypothetical protein